MYILSYNKKSIKNKSINNRINKTYNSLKKFIIIK